MGARYRRLTHLVVAKLLALTTVGAGPTLPSKAMAANYSFVNVADTTGPFNLVGAPSINAGGTVAFVATFDAGGEGIFTGNGGPLTTIADASGPFASFGSYLGINDAGVVVFRAYRDDASQGVFSGSGGAIATVADSSGPLNHFGSSVAPSINAAGKVAFYATYDAGGAGLFINDGGALVTVADTLGPYNIFDTGGANPSLNDAGLVAFYSTLDGGGQGVYSGNGGPVATIADASGPFALLRVPSINNIGEYAFSVRLDLGGEQVLKTSGGSLVPVADTSGPYFSFSFTAINNSGGVAFRASALDAGGTGIYIGPDAVADKVIQTGDPLFGSTVTGLIFVRGLNNRGDVAFQYELANGVAGAAVARIVPEPSSAILLAVGVRSARRSRFRRGVCGAK